MALEEAVDNSALLGLISPLCWSHFSPGNYETCLNVTLNLLSYWRYILYSVALRWRTRNLLIPIGYGRNFLLFRLIGRFVRQLYKWICRCLQRESHQKRSSTDAVDPQFSIRFYYFVRILSVLDHICKLVLCRSFFSHLRSTWRCDQRWQSCIGARILSRLQFLHLVCSATSGVLVLLIDELMR